APLAIALHADIDVDVILLHTDTALLARHGFLTGLLLHVGVGLGAHPLFLGRRGLLATLFVHLLVLLLHLLAGDRAVFTDAFLTVHLLLRILSADKARTG